MHSSSSKCLVCEDGADSLHFGALSCRACAAFFRRKVASGRNLHRRCDQECKMNTGLRKLCASCRFEKCLKVGMKESAVLTRIANAASNSSKKVIEVECSPSTSSTGNTLLKKLNEAYEKLERNRKLFFNITEQTTPKMCNYKMMNEIGIIDTRFIAEVFGSVFNGCSKLPQEQKKLLLRHFIVPFIILEGGYKSTSYKNIFVMANGDYVDLAQIEVYYKSPEEVNNSDDSKAVELFKPYWKLHQQLMKGQLDETKLDKVEFIFLSAMIYWDFGLQGQTDECIEVCREMRTQAIEELTEHEKIKQSKTDHCYRVGQIMMLLQSMQRTMNMVQETMQVSQVYDLYERHFSFFDAMNVDK